MTMTLSLLVSITLLLTGPDTENAERYWPQWRGPLGTGEAPNADPPTAWSETKNVKWKVEVPGSGLATPVIWKDRVYIQAAIETDQILEESKPAAGVSDNGAAARERERNRAEGDGGGRDGGDRADGDRGGRRRGGRRGGFGERESGPKKVNQFALIAYDRQTGKEVMRKIACEAAPHESIHNDSTNASNSPVTDGTHIYAYFGSRGIYCYDMDGDLKWSKDLGDMTTRRGFGEGSSPALHGNTLVITWDHEGPSFIVALDKKTGKELWRQDRDEQTSWATPMIVEVEGKPQVVVNGTNRVRSYDLASGKLMWECGGQTTNAIPTPVHANGMAYVMSGFRGAALRAIRLASASGDITEGAAVAWRHDKDTPYVPSPVLADHYLYFLKSNDNILTCLDARDGSRQFTERLEGIENVYASPVAANGRVYVTGRDGTVQVLQQGGKLEVLATNKVDDRVDASPAIVGKELFLRGHKKLYCIVE